MHINGIGFSGVSGSLCRVTFVGGRPRKKSRAFPLGSTYAVSTDGAYGVLYLYMLRNTIRNILWNILRSIIRDTE